MKLLDTLYELSYHQLMAIDRDFNQIKEWLDPQLARLGMSVEKFANNIGLSKASIYFYRSDKCRPDSDTMAKMCKFLGRPFEEGLAQYTPKKEGRPGHL